jgi:glycosyltransferase involved in cell wall biosynthesis
MFRKGIEANPKYDCIRVHSVYLTDEHQILFPRISVNEKGELSANIPLPQNCKLLFDVFWKKKYFKAVTEILTPYVEKIKNPVFTYHNLFLSEMAIAFRNCFGGKLVTHLHCLPWKFDLENDMEKFNKLYQLFAEKNYEDFRKLEESKVNYSVSDRIICISESAIDYLTNIHHVDRNKIRMVRNGLKIQNAAVKETQRQSMPPEILYAGKVSKDKGIYEMLDALKLVKKRGFDFKLKLAGTILDHDINRIKTKYAGINIEILGEIPFEELQRHYAACTIGIVPSLHEQFCYVALEMAAFSVPIVVSQVDGLAEIFEHQKTAMLVPMLFDPDFGLSADTEKFADNIIRLMTDAGLRNILSRNVHKLYEEDYTLEKMISNTIKIYEELCLKYQF